jgi:hypothetical protein
MDINVKSRQCGKTKEYIKEQELSITKQYVQKVLVEIGCPFSVDEILEKGVENFQSSLWKPKQNDNGLYNIINKQTGFIRCFNYTELMAIKEMALLRRYQ